MRDVIFLGLVIGIVFYELTSITPGGVIVPGLMAYYIFDYQRLLVTLVIAVLTYLVYLLLNKFVILYGKRKYAVFLIIGVMITLVFSLLSNIPILSFLGIPIVGYIVPGIVASNFSKQGLIKTTLGLSICMGFTGLIVWLFV